MSTRSHTKDCKIENSKIDKFLQGLVILTEGNQLVGEVADYIHEWLLDI